MKSQTLDRRLITILLIVFVQMLGSSIVLPILPIYAKDEFGLRPEAISLLISSFFMAQFIAGPTMGRWSDKYGRVPVLVISQIGTAVSFVMLGFAYAPWVLFASRILDGITGGNIIVAQAYVTDIMPKEERTKALGLIFAAFGLGFMFGPALGGVLSAWFGPTAPFVVAAVATTAVVVLTYVTLDETITKDQQALYKKSTVHSLNLGDIFTNSSLLTVMVIAFIGQFGLGLLQSTFALYSEAVLFAGYDKDTTSIGIGLLLTVVGITQVLTQSVVLPRVSKQFNEITLIAAGFIVRTISMFIFAIVTNPWLGTFGSFFFALGMGILMPPLQAYTTKLVTDDQRGTVLGWFQSVVSLATIFSTALGGWLFAISPTIPYWVGGLLSIIMVIPVLTVLRQPETEPLTAES